jgi:predicted enzyme related to lactoylglutathione lyase
MSQKEHDRRIDYVEFAAEDVAGAKRFYQAVFGWTFKDYGPDYVSFRDGRLEGGFRKGEVVSGDGAPLVVVYVTDLEGTAEKIRRNGGRIVKEVFEFPGGRRFHFSDPAGNVLAAWSE